MIVEEFAFDIDEDHRVIGIPGTEDLPERGKMVIVQVIVDDVATEERHVIQAGRQTQRK